MQQVTASLHHGVLKSHEIRVLECAKDALEAEVKRLRERESM
jgi:hypothetical protein